MKKTNLLILCLSAAFLASCGGNASSSSSNSSIVSSSSESSAPASSSSQQQEEAAKVVASFITTAKMSYSNMRPNYNYYLTTFAFETLTLYDNGTYVLDYSTSTFSAVILPEEGNAATANERSNSLISFYGQYEAVVDDLDEDALVITLKKASRMAGVDDAKGHLDTDIWNAAMKGAYADIEYGYDAETQQQVETGRKEYDTGADYVAAHAFDETSDIYASKANGEVDWVDVNVHTSDAKGPTAASIGEKAVRNAFITSAKMSYSNMRPNYNYYLTTFAFETLTLYEDGTYGLAYSSSTFSAVILPEEGNAATANERNNSLIRYFGSYEAQVDDLDDTALVVDLSSPSRIAGVDDAKGHIDTDIWNDQMKEKWADIEYGYDAETQQQVETGRKEYATGAEYVAAHGFKAVEDIYAATQSGEFDWVDVNAR